MNCKIK